jgi:2'-5' RNA ligase
MADFKMPVYDQMWEAASTALTVSAPELDTVLPRKIGDARRGFTLVFRPSTQVREAVAGFLCQLEAECPGQYVYRPEELHITVIALINGTPDWRRQLSNIPVFQEILRSVFVRQQRFGITFQGVTASPAAVMIQGFPADAGLQTLRDAIRGAFAARGLGAFLDVRYKITAAHITGMRFCTTLPVEHWRRFGAWLTREREQKRDFGTMTVESCDLIFTDWYSSASMVQTVETYPLSPGDSRLGIS